MFYRRGDWECAGCDVICGEYRSVTIEGINHFLIEREQLKNTVLNDKSLEK